MIWVLNYPRQFAINKTSFRFPDNNMYNAVKQHPVKTESCLLSHMLSPTPYFIDLLFHHFKVTLKGFNALYIF